jgi:hypothetical protein
LIFTQASRQKKQTTKVEYFDWDMNLIEMAEHLYHSVSLGSTYSLTLKNLSNISSECTGMLTETQANLLRTKVLESSSLFHSRQIRPFTHSNIDALLEELCCGLSSQHNIHKSKNAFE